MIYRIRYRRPDATDDREFVVEASSPTEAMVKFNHTHDGAGELSRCARVVTSVRAEDTGEEIAW